MIDYEDFKKVDIRIGRVVEVKNFPDGKYSTHILKIDFGEEVGTKTSLARLAPNYQGRELIGMEIVGVINLKPRQIGKHMSEALILGSADEYGNVALLHPGKVVPVGERIY